MVQDAVTDSEDPDHDGGRPRATARALVQGIGASPAERSRFDDCALVLSDSVRTQVVSSW
jgi:hypothetical protein